MKLTISQSEINKIMQSTKKDILIPTLKDISHGMRKSISTAATPFAANKKSSSIPSIKNMSATKQSVRTKILKSKISPVIPTFQINKDGYSRDLYVYVYDKPGLREWVANNYTNTNNKEEILSGRKRLHIRGKYNLGGYQAKPPLGDPERDVFKEGFLNFIINKEMYGLS